MTFKFQYNKSENNKVDKDLQDIWTTTGTMKDETSIIDPVFMISDDGTHVLGSNYLTCEDLGRSYFITDISSYRNGVWMVTCHVDVLSSFKEEIRANSAIIMKQENKWNLYVDDGTFKVYQNPTIYTKAFPTGFSTYEFVLAVAGSEAAI